MSPCQPHAR